MAEKVGDLEIGIGVDTTELDEAIDKAGELSEVTSDFSPQVSIRNCKGCTFNIYPSRSTINERNLIIPPLEKADNPSWRFSDQYADEDDLR